MTRVFSWAAAEIQRFLEEVTSLGYTDQPRYQELRCILRAGLTAQARDSGKLDFSPATGPVPRPVQVWNMS